MMQVHHNLKNMVNMYIHGKDMKRNIKEQDNSILNLLYKLYEEISHVEK